MKLDPHPPRTAIDTNASALLDPVEVIHAMIDLRFHLAELEAQIQALKPAFFAACVALNTEKITLEQAIVSRQLTPKQWTYSLNIVQQADLLRPSKTTVGTARTHRIDYERDRPTAQLESSASRSLAQPSSLLEFKQRSARPIDR